MGRYHTHLYIQCSDLRNLCCSATSVVRRKAETHSIIVRKNECHSYIALQFLILHCSFFFLSRRLPGFISALSSPSDLLAAKILEGNRLIFSSFQVLVNSIFLCFYWIYTGFFEFLRRAVKYNLVSSQSSLDK